jgi:release factor glutamine methyltransferase
MGCMITIKQAWTSAREQLNLTSPSASLDAQLLLCDVLGADDRAYLIAHDTDTLTDAQQTAYAALVRRRAAGEPIAYIRGYQNWYDRQILVTPAVLIPRPETELLLEAALAEVASHPAPTVADVCTGSGAIAVTLKANAPHATVYGTDISTAALDVAARNADNAGVVVQWLHGDLLAPLAAATVQLDVLITNPPYIASDELRTLAVAKHEPIMALDGGADGLDFVRQILTDVPSVLKRGGLLLIEIGAAQGDAVRQLAASMLTVSAVEIRKDYAGHDRFLWARFG